VLAVLGSDDFIYKVLFLLHILAALVAFAPAFVWPIARAQARKRGAVVPADLTAQAAVNEAVIHGPAVIATGVFGILMVVMAEGDFYEFSQAWISIAFVVWFAMLGVVYGLLVPSGRKAAAGDTGAEAKLPMYTGFLHILLLIMLVVMIWKPGL
jgi:uncharacterized membrane protein